MVSLGILMNEILLNVFKHAFLNHDHPEIEIEAQATVERVLIRIKDNGPGIDPSIVNNATNDSTIGMKVINGLLGQLRSELEISNNDGTEFRITLNKLKVTL
jgi:two-component sensor histidine kinase